MTDLPEELLSFLKKNGHQYPAALRLPGMPRGRVGHCFDTCLLAAFKNDKWRYVEGMAENPRDYSEWILHAWLTDGRWAFDLTWRGYFGLKEVPLPVRYVGIEMDKRKVAAFVLKTGYCGVLANAWRFPDIARSILPTAPLVKVNEQVMA